MKRRKNRFEIPNGDIELAQHFYGIMMTAIGKNDSDHSEPQSTSEVEKSEFGGAINQLRASIRAKQAHQSA